LRKLPALLVVAGVLAVLVLSSVGVRDTRNDHAMIASSDAWPGLVRTAPITIASDADFPLNGFIGSGTAGDPWVLDNVLIECNETASGIVITGTTEYAVISNSFINESMAAGYAIGVQTSNNVIVRNCTVEDSLGIAIATAIAGNVLLDGCTITNATMGIYVDGAWYIDVNDTVIDDCSIAGYVVSTAFTTNASAFLNITDSTFSTNSYDINVMNVSTFLIDGCQVISNPGGEKIQVIDSNNTTFMNNNVTLSDVPDVTFDNIDTLIVDNNTFAHVDIDNSVHVTVTNNMVHDDTVRAFGGAYKTGIIIQHTNQSAIVDNTFSGRGLVCGLQSYTCENQTISNNVFNATYDIGIAIDIGVDNIDVFNNTVVDPIPDATLSFGMVIDFTPGFVNVTGNTFVNMSRAVSTAMAANNYTNKFVRYNWFTDVDEPYFNNVGDPDELHFDHNYYQEYFDIFPYAITANATTDVLEFDWPVSVTLNDTYPLYWEPWYPRSQVVNIHAFSNVDGQGISFDNLKIYIDGVQIATASPTIYYVLFRLTIEDYRGRLLYDQMHNLNSTTANLNVGLDIAVQIWVNFWSSLDPFGFEFSLATLWIDGVRCPINNPIMDHEIITVAVTDKFGQQLYNETLNLTVTGVFVDIYMDITTLVVQNNFGFGVYFHYAVGGVEISFPMASRQTVDDLRVSLGTYTWWVTDEAGNVLDDESGTPYSESKTLSGPAIIEFGWTEGTIVPDPMNAYITVLMVVTGFGAGIGIPLAWLGAPKQRPQVKRRGSKGSSQMKDK